MAAYLLDRHVSEGRGSRIAVRTRGKLYTYRDVLAMVNRAGNAFTELGLNVEERCLILLPDSPEFITSFLGAMKIGAVPVPVNTQGSQQDFLYYLDDSRARLVILSPEVWPRIEPIKDRLRHVRYLVMAGVETPPGCESFHRLLEQSSDDLDVCPTSRDDPSYWLYTSGTTGQPKGVIHLHHDMLHCVEPYSSHVLGTSPDDVFFSASKLFFSYGLVNSLYLPFFAGASVFLDPERPAPPNLYETIEHERPTLFFTVPTSLAAMLNDPASHDLSSLRLCISAGEPLPAAIYQRWRQRYGTEILDGIGSSEFGYIFISNRPGEVKPGASGKVLPPHEARILSETGQPTRLGEVGELYVRSDSVAAGYWHKHVQTKETFAGDWLRTHDSFLLDEDGFYVYQGRADDMFKVAGLYVSSAEVENVLLTHEAISECAVVAAGDSDGLLKPKACVVVREGISPGPDLAAELQTFARDRLAHYKCPRWIEFLPTLPKTATGKIQRYKLRQQ